MNRQRRFLKLSLELISSTGLLFSPLFSWIRLVHARTQKVILPKDTPQEDLAYKNPAEYVYKITVDNPAGYLYQC